MREILVINALNERDLLRDRIFQQIGKMRFVDYKKQCEERTAGMLMEEKAFCEKVKSDFQSFQDLIRNYDEIDAAIVASNATTIIKTNYGEYTVAAAIAQKQRLKVSSERENIRRTPLFDDSRTIKGDFETEAIQLMQNQMVEVMEKVKKAQTSLEASAEEMRNSILGSDKAKKDAASMAVVDEYLKTNRYKLVDPLNLTEKLAQMKTDRDALYSELDTAIKISNATTKIQVNF